MLNRRFVLMLVAALVVSSEGIAAQETPPTPEMAHPFGAEFASRMKESLSLTDAQVLKLEPLITTRIETVDAALIAIESAEKPDVAAFIEGYGEIKTEFEAGVIKVLTLDQRGPWESFKVEFEKDLVDAGATKRLVELQTLLKLTDEQVNRMRPAMASSLQKKLDLFQELAQDTTINIREERRARRTLDDLNAELEKSISKVLTVDQRNVYKKLQGQ